MAVKVEATPQTSFQNRVVDSLSEFPLWALIVIFFGTFLVFQFLFDDTYNEIIRFLIDGVRLTIFVTLTSYIMALVLGLTTAVGQLSDNLIIRNIAQLYVQVIRGVPILVQIFYWAFVIFPLFNKLGEWMVEINFLAVLGLPLSTWKSEFITRGIMALAFSYGAFSSEIFRAGIQSIEKGQREAALALGLSKFQSFRFIIFPQAVRRILPPLGNDFIAMLKETSLVSVLGVGEITQLGKKYGAASFRYPPTYNTVAFLYLSMTLLLSMGVRTMERRLRTNQAK